MLRLKAKEFSTDPAFKASLGWYQNWKRRHSMSFRAKTTLAQRLPEDMEEKIRQFHRFVIAARQRAGYPLSRIYNMDETPMRFQLPSTRSLEFTGSRTVPVKTCGAEKRSFTVTLAVAVDGTKLPPKVIFKGVRSPRDLVVPESLRVSFHKKGWMDEAGVKEWIRQCLPWTPRNEQSLLVWDSFRAHLTDEEKADLKRQKIDVAVIPGGLTPVLQKILYFDGCMKHGERSRWRWLLSPSRPVESPTLWMELRTTSCTLTGRRKSTMMKKTTSLRRRVKARAMASKLFIS